MGQDNRMKGGSDPAVMDQWRRMLADAIITLKQP
jgi:hypothetical protein